MSTKAVDNRNYFGHTADGRKERVCKQCIFGYHSHITPCFLVI